MKTSDMTQYMETNTCLRGITRQKTELRTKYMRLAVIAMSRK